MKYHLRDSFCICCSVQFQLPVMIMPIGKGNEQCLPIELTNSYLFCYDRNKNFTYHYSSHRSMQWDCQDEYGLSINSNSNYKTNCKDDRYGRMVFWDGSMALILILV